MARIAATLRALAALTVLMAAALALTGPGVQAQEAPRAVAVNYPLQYFAQRLLGDAAEVSFPVPEGVDPSFWRPSIAEISAIQSADLILLNGAGFATWVDRVSLPRSRLVNTTRAVEDRFIFTESITHSHGDGGEHSHDAVASYTWLDLTLAGAQADAIAAAIARKNLAPPDAVYARLTELLSELDALDSAASATLSAAQGVPMIATHPRYQYLARRYGLSLSSLEWEAGAAPSATDLAALEALAAETGARILIWEAKPPQAALEAVQERGLKSVVFEPLARPPQAGAESYLQAFEAAVASLADAVAQQPGN
ncbi:MAG: zinc ABC transporter substrate-binding protein [Pseudomonadota bacterium]